VLLLTRSSRPSLSSSMSCLRSWRGQHLPCQCEHTHADAAGAERVPMAREASSESGRSGE
jgi:hypothetical protein